MLPFQRRVKVGSNPPLPSPAAPRTPNADGAANRNTSRVGLQLTSNRVLAFPRFEEQISRAYRTAS